MAYIVSELTEPAAFGVAVTPSNDTVLTATRGLYIGAAGNLNVVMAGDGGTVFFGTVPAASILPIRVTKVLSTSTTASGIVALW